MCAFHPNAQARLITHGDFNALETFKNSLTTVAPWDSIYEFATSDKYCAKKLYPRQLTLLRLAFLETEQMTQYDLDVIEEWRTGFLKSKERFGVQPDIWDRVKYLKERGYRRFPHIQAVMGRRASKGLLGGILGAEQIAYFYSLDDWQSHFGVDPGQSGAVSVVATNETQARRFQFADIRRTIENCRYLRGSIATSKEYYMSIRTPADVRRIAELSTAGLKVEHEIATLIVIALSSSSSSGRGGVGICLDPETPVLTADLKWVPIKSVQPGDELVGVDEYPEPGKRRKMRRSIVLAKDSNRQKSYRLTFDNGRSVVCSADHRWLCRTSKGGKNYKWRKTHGSRYGEQITPGTEIVQLVEPWEEDNSFESGYLAGFFDGEGHVTKESYGGIGVFYSQCPGPVLDFVSKTLKEKGFNPQPQNGHAYRPDGDLRCQQWAIRGVADVLRFLGQISPMRLAKPSVWDGISLKNTGVRRGYYQPSHIATVVSVEELPEQDLIDIQTSTKTFIANGLVSHNCNFYDEMAHLLSNTGSIKAGDEIYNAWQPSLDQFGKDALTYCPSSPFSKIGIFFQLYQQGSALMVRYLPDGTPETTVETEKTLDIDVEEELAEFTANPEMLVVQQPSWNMYLDWERGPELVGVKFKRPIQVYDERMVRLERANPEKFKVERRAQFAEVEDAYLDPDKVDEMFVHPTWREPLEPQQFGRFDRKYRIHCDPGRVNANFALIVAHLEDAPPDEHDEVWPHVIMDYIKVWKPGDYADHTVDYVQVQDEISTVLRRFPSTSKISFDQWNSASFIANIRREFSPNIRVTEEAYTEKINQMRCERFKSALNLGWVHAYLDSFGNDGNCLLEEEMKFLQLKNGKVIKQDFGPVTTKDAFDCLSVVVTDLLHDALDRWALKLATGSAYGVTDVAGLRSGRELERIGALTGGGMDRRGSLAREFLNSQSIERSLNRYRMTREKGFPTRGRVDPPPGFRGRR